MEILSMQVIIQKKSSLWFQIPWSSWNQMDLFLFVSLHIPPLPSISLSSFFLPFPLSPFLYLCSNTDFLGSNGHLLFITIPYSFSLFNLPTSLFILSSLSCPFIPFLTIFIYLYCISSENIKIYTFIGVI